MVFNSNTFAGLVGKVRKKYLPEEEGRGGGERGPNPGPAAC